MSLIINIHEQQILPAERFLIIDSLFTFEFPKSTDDLKRNRYPHKNDAEFESIKQEFKSFVREHENSNLISVGMYNAYADIHLPKVYEVYFRLA